MRVTLSPIAGLPGQSETSIEVAGDTITVDGQPFDLSAIPEGGEAQFEGAHPFIGPATRQDGRVHCTVATFYDEATAEPAQPTDEALWTIEQDGGTIVLPVVRRAAPAVEGEPLV